MENNSEYGIYEEFLKNFDSVNYKNKDSSIINNEFQKVISELCEKDMINVALQAELDRQVFLIRKSFEFQDDETKGTIKGLSWQMAGTQDMANGDKIPFYWPNVRNLTKENFEFFEQRYKKTNNLYAKTEYGLMVYFGQKTDWSKNNSFKLQLCNELISLAQEYYGEAQKGEYFKLGYVLNRLELALQIAINSKFEDCQKAIIEQVFDIQQHWSVNDNTKHVPLNYSRFMLEHYSICKKYIDFEKVIERNKYAISLIEKDNLYMAADAIEFTDKLKQKINLSIEDSLRQRAEVYEQIAKSRQEDIASMHFIKLALDIYLKIKDNTKIEEMEKLYSEKRNTFQLTETSIPIPDDYIKAIDKAVKQTIETCSVDELLDQFAETPWYETDDSIQTLSDVTLRQRAEVYEQIAKSRQEDIASMHFIKLALDIYLKIKDNTKIEEMEKLYSEKRNTFQLTETSIPIPDDYIKAIDKAVKQTIETCSVDELLDQFAETPWYETDDSIQTLSDVTDNGLIDILPLSSIDRYGNTVKTYTPAEGKFWSTYSFFFKIGTLKMLKLFVAAIDSQKLSYDSVLNYLEKTWLNEPIERNYNSKKVCVVPLDTVKPGLKRIFDELKQAEGSYILDYVTIVDSLTLKIEGLLRFFIEKLKIPTFAKRRSKDGDVIMEKLFDDIIADLKGTPERPSGFVKDHLTMFKYVMSEKIGWNLRNEVAHSLLQIEDYSLDKVVVLFCLILKLSKYIFKEQCEN